MRYIERDLPIEGLSAISQKEGNAGKPIYQMHRWWDRRPGSVFRMLILASFTEYDESLTPEANERRLWARFYDRNELRNEEGKAPIILDPFMGGGATVVEGRRLGAKVIGIDLNPVAWFVTKKEVDPVDLGELDAAFKHLENTVAPEIKRYYRTTCLKGHQAEVAYVFWVRKVPCLGCGQEVRLFPLLRIASKDGKHTVFCPRCYHVTNDVPSLGDAVECPGCGDNYVPLKGFAGGGNYTCPSCGHMAKVLDAIQQMEAPPEAEMFALEYHCRTCGRGYKGATRQDRDLYEEARRTFRRRRTSLPFPRTKIPEDGLSETWPTNFGYKYFYQMFNERQLLCLGRLLEEVLKLPDKDTQEYLLLAFSSMVETNNTFCGSNELEQRVESIFAGHACRPPHTFGEGNVWGTKLAEGSFVAAYQKMMKGKQYALKPYELESPYRRTRKVVGDAAIGKVGTVLKVDWPPARPENDIALRAETAENLSRELPAVDAVITDLPHGDSVTYPELADFFYVWLQLGLKDRYPWFKPEVPLRAHETAKDSDRRDERKEPGQAAGYSGDFFPQSVTGTFEECRRIMRDDGLLVFTIHHHEPRTWKPVLRSILEAGFYIGAVYPIPTDINASTRPAETKGISYDIPFVCLKRLRQASSIDWDTLKAQIRAAAEQAIDRMRHHHGMSDADLLVVGMGRCLELYSWHWPNVWAERRQVDVDSAVDEMEQIVDSLIEA